MGSDKRTLIHLGIFPFHIAFVVGVSCYFLGLLAWFGTLFAGGGAEEHAVLSLVIPLVATLGTLAVISFSIIIAEGRRASATESRETGAAEKQATGAAENQLPDP